MGGSDQFAKPVAAQVALQGAAFKLNCSVRTVLLSTGVLREEELQVHHFLFVAIEPKAALIQVYSTECAINFGCSVHCSKFNPIKTNNIYKVKQKLPVDV